jgi:hypothetical protein
MRGTFTPGPWTNYGNTEIRAANGFTIAVVTKPGLRNAITDANARLIAVAPELAEAAAAFRLHFFCDNSRYFRERLQVVERLDAALRDAGINVGQAPEEKR